MPLEKLEAFIFEQLAATHLPGLSAAVVRDGDVIWARGFGFRDLAAGLPATPDTLYGIGSVTKSFTTLAIMQLAEAGLLSVDDPVEKFIPEFQVRPGGEPVRLWHLMTHTSGLPALAYMEQVIYAHSDGSDIPLPIGTAADLLTFMKDASDWTLNRPGERWYYLNEGFALLGEIIARVSGKPYAQYVAERILKPLGMTRTTFDQAALAADKNVAVPYVITPEGQREPSSYVFNTLQADGALVSSVAEMARYIQMYLNGGEYNGARLIGAASLAEMQTPRITQPERRTHFGPPGYAYGLSVTPDFLGRQVIGHGGSVGVATAHMAFIPAENIGIMVLANGLGYPMNNFALYGLAELLGEDPEALPFVRPMRRLEALTGTYETYKATMRVQIRRAGDFLIYEKAGKLSQARVTLIPDEIGDDVSTFYVQDGGGVQMPVEFRRKPEGPTEMIFGRYLFRRTGKLP